SCTSAPETSRHACTGLRTFGAIYGISQTSRKGRQHPPSRLTQRHRGREEPSIRHTRPTGHSYSPPIQDRIEGTPRPGSLQASDAPTTTHRTKMTGRDQIRTLSHTRLCRRRPPGTATCDDQPRTVITPEPDLPWSPTVRPATLPLVLINASS